MCASQEPDAELLSWVKREAMRDHQLAVIEPSRKRVCGGDYRKQRAPGRVDLQLPTRIETSEVILVGTKSLW